MDTYKIDQMGFQMGINSSKVVITNFECRIRPTVVQLSNWEEIKVIHGTYAVDCTIPLFTIF